MIEEKLPSVTIVTGDREIRRILQTEAALVLPAFACRYDGFVNDTFSEYANPSILRPASVRRAQLPSELSAYFYNEDVDADALAQPPVPDHLFDFQSVRCLPAAGEYYIGWTMYDSADAEENVTAWVGARQVAYVCSPDNDNRLHLYVLNELFYIEEGERLRLVTDANTGHYRFEQIVLLRALPQVTPNPVHFSAISAEIDESTNERPTVRLNWRSSRPTRCKVTVGQGDKILGEVGEAKWLANHSVTLPTFDGSLDPWLLIEGQTQLGEHVSTVKTQLMALLPTASGTAQAGQIVFSVINPLDVATTAWPITWGLPLPRSALWQLDQCHLVGPNGGVMPVQKRVQVFWDDGSIRWLLLDFQIDLPATGQQALTLEYGPEISDTLPSGLHSIATEQGIVVDTGCLRLNFSRAAYAFPAQVAVRQGDIFTAVLGQRSALPAITLLDATGQQFTTAGEIDEISLEEIGPLRTTVRIATKHRAADGAALFRSIIRVSVYAGKSFLRVQHTFENDHVDNLFTEIRSLTLGANIVDDWLDQAWVGDQRVALDKGAVHLSQPLADHFQIEQASATIQMGEQAPHWWAVGGQAGTVAVTMRNFWENYPKGWQADARGIQIEIFPDITNVAYPSAEPAATRALFYIQEGQYKLKCGVARTHDMLFVLSATDQNNTEPTILDTVRLFNSPPLVRLPPALLEKTGVLSALCPRGKSGAEDYDRWVDTSLALFEQDRLETQAYGLLNFGDWYGERRYNWGNLEYDTPYGFLLEYLRGGADRFFTLGWQAAWHLADVDTCHYHAEPGKVGLQYLHSLGHVGSYYPDGYLAGAIAHEEMEWSHTWVEGLYLYALLTGEPSLWQAANRPVEILAGVELNDFDFTNCRDCGWPLRHLIGAYQATGRQLFLNGAAIIVERVLERQRATGGWERLLVPGHCFHVPPRHMGNAGFMVGVLLAALKRYHETTQDAAVGQAIIAAAHYLVRSMWEPDSAAFRYTSCPQSRTARELNAQILEGVGYAWRLSNDPALGDVLRAGLAACLTTPHNSTTPPDAKDISTRLRSLPFIMADIVRAGAS